MSEENVQEKIAARLTIDISPAQGQMLQLEHSYEDHKSRMLAIGESIVDSDLRLLESSGEQKRSLTALQEAKILEIQKDGELKRAMAQAAFNQTSEAEQAEHIARMLVIEAESRATLEMMLQTSSLKTMAILQQSEAKTSAFLEESALKRQALSDRIFQSQEQHEVRLDALKATSEARANAISQESALKQMALGDNLYMKQQEHLARMETLNANAERAQLRLESARLTQSETMDKLHYEALQENRARDQALQEAAITRRMRNIQTFYDLELTTARDALVQLKTLMNEEYTFFANNEAKKTQAMRMEYQLRGAIAKQSAGSGAGLDFGGLNTHVLNNVKSFAAGLAVINIVNELQKIPKTIMDVTGSVNKLKQVLELSEQIKSVQQLDDTVGQLQLVAERQAVIYGRDVSEVLDVMTEAGRRFKDVPSIIVATDNALQAMVADNVDAEKAIKGEEAMMAQFGLTLKDTREAWAKLTVASHEFMTDASSIIDGLERSGSAFKAMKVNTSEAIAAVVALSQESGRTGAVVGNSWKSIENTLGSKDGIKALHQLGIEAKTDNGVLTDGLTILGKLQEKWPQLSEASRAAFATALAGGKYQYNQLLTFLDNTSGTFVKALDAMKKANVETQQELVKTAMESLPAQAKMTSAQLQVMATSFSNVLTPAMMTFFMDMREGSKWIGDHANAIEHLIGTGMKLAEAYVAWKVGLKLYTAALESSTLATISAALANARLNISFGLLIAQRVGVVAGMKAIGASMLEAAGSAALAASRIAALVAVVSIFNSVAERKADPLAAKERDLENQISDLQEQKNSSPTGKVLKGAWSVFSSTWKSGFDPAAMDDAYTKTMGALNTNNYDAQIAKAQKELDAVHQQKKDRATKEFDDYQKMIDDAMKAATPVGPPTPSELPSGDLNIDPNPEKPKKQSAADYAQPYRDMIQQMEEDLSPLINVTKSLDNVLEDLGTKQDTLNNRLKYGATDMSLSGQNTQIYLQRLTSLKTQQDSLHATNDQVRADMANVAAQIKALNPNNLPISQLSDGQREAIKFLSDEYDKLAQQERDNSKKWIEDTRSAIQATDDWTNAFIKLEENALAPIDRALKTIENRLKTAKSNMSLDESKIKHGDTSDATAADYAKSYNDQIDAMTEKEKKLKEEREQHAKAVNDLQYTLKNLDKTSAGYEAAVSNLTQAIDTHKNAMADLDEQISQTEVDMQSLSDTVSQKIEDFLKTGYELEQKVEEQKLKKYYDDKITGIQNQIDATDELIKKLDEQYQKEDALQQLHDLETEETNVKSQLDHQIVGLDGKLTRTYDVQKVTDLDKQIADQKKKIERDAAKQKLEDEKAELEKQLKQVQDEYEKEKQQLDDYWSYRLSEDKIKQEAARLQAKEGYGKALKDAQQFANDMNSAFDSINWGSIDAGAQIANRYGGKDAGNAGSGSSSITDVLSIGSTMSNWLKETLVGDGGPTLSLAGIAQMDTGGVVPHDGLAVVHQNEVVVSSPVVESIKEMPRLADYAKALEAPQMYRPDLSGVKSVTNVRHSVNIEKIVLPEVKQPTDFVLALSRVLRGATFSLQAGVTP